MPTYTRSQFYSDIQRDASAQADIVNVVNRAIRTVIGEIDVRSSKRMSYLSPLLNEEQYDYVAPSDLKETAIVDIRRLANRLESDKFQIVTTEYFDRNKQFRLNLVCIEDQNFLKKLRISANLDRDTKQATVHDMDSDTANGTWSASSDASNLTIDSDIFVEGAASLNFDMGASYTSGILTNSDFTVADLSNFTSQGAMYFMVWIPSTTGLTSFKLRIGTDASNYYEGTATSTNETLAFQTGWNLIRFNFNAMTETGTVTDTSIGYLRIQIVGAGTASATTDWRIDQIVARTGLQHQVWYYTRYGWQSSSGTYLENSTADSDLINCDTEEYELFILKGRQLFHEELMLWGEADKYQQRYEVAKQRYLDHYSSERLRLIQKYYKMSSDFNDDILLR